MRLENIFNNFQMIKLYEFECSENFGTSLEIFTDESTSKNGKIMLSVRSFKIVHTLSQKSNTCIFENYLEICENFSEL